MLFNSTEFLFGFLPLVFAGYFLLLRWSQSGAKLWLLAASLYFYAYWELNYLPLISASILLNYSCGRLLASERYSPLSRKLILVCGLLANVALLGYYKYADFVIENINLFIDNDISLLHLLLPLAISFFTFQQIAYLVDAYRREVRENNLIDYALFVCFFPQLIAGPIVHHKQMMPQFNELAVTRPDYRNMGVGLLLLGIGLFKKTIIADPLGLWVNQGYQDVNGISMLGSWLLSLAFTLQLTFDFTAYSDMAIGIALLFNIRLPINFLSALRASNITIFWQRWHLTLTSFLRNYIYFPLGGSRKGFWRGQLNLFIVFMVAGIWHGSGWNFFIWGILQGTANVLHRLWQRQGLKMPVWLGWLLTFNFLNIICVFFRAPGFADAMQVIYGMVGLHGLSPTAPLAAQNSWLFSPALTELGGEIQLVIWVIGAMLLCLLAPNAMSIARTVRLNRRTALYTGFLLGVSVLTTLKVQDEFIYFNF